MPHPSEDDLALLAFDAASLPNAAEIDAHVAGCEECLRIVQTYRALDGDYRDGETWQLAETAPSVAAGRDSLRRLAAQIATEDEQADRLLGGALQAPTAVAWLDIHFVHLGDDERRMRARHLQANIWFQLQQIAAARDLYEEILGWARAHGDLVWIARESRTLGHCALESGDLVAATRYFEAAVRAFRQLGETSEVTRTEWGIGRVLLALGRIDEAILYLGKVEEKLRGHGLVTDAALVAFHVMDAWHSKSCIHEIASKAGALIDVFTNAGMLTSALQALAYLKEAAECDRVTLDVIEHVRQFVSRVERQPDLLFAPPPNETR